MVKVNNLLRILIVIEFFLGKDRVCQPNSVCREGPFESNCDCNPGYSEVFELGKFYCRRKFVKFGVTRMVSAFLFGNTQYFSQKNN